MGEGPKEMSTGAIFHARTVGRVPAPRALTATSSLDPGRAFCPQVTHPSLCTPSGKTVTGMFAIKGPSASFIAEKCAHLGSFLNVRFGNSYTPVVLELSTTEKVH